jgi:hypothetical protein
MRRSRRPDGYGSAVLLRALGLLLLVGGGTIATRARLINDWAFRINREQFGWEGGRSLRAYGLLVTAATGLIVLGLGMLYLVQGADALPG